MDAPCSVVPFPGGPALQGHVRSPISLPGGSPCLSSSMTPAWSRFPIFLFRTRTGSFSKPSCCWSGGFSKQGHVLSGRSGQGLPSFEAGRRAQRNIRRRVHEQHARRAGRGADVPWNDHADLGLSTCRAAARVATERRCGHLRASAPLGHHRAIQCGSVADRAVEDGLGAYRRAGTRPFRDWSGRTVLVRRVWSFVHRSQRRLRPPLFPCDSTEKVCGVPAMRIVCWGGSGFAFDYGS